MIAGLSAHDDPATSGRIVSFWRFGEALVVLVSRPSVGIALSFIYSLAYICVLDVDI